MESIFRKFFKDKPEPLSPAHDFIAQNKIIFNDSIIISINGHLLKEYEYLLQHYTNYQLQNFDNLTLISRYSGRIISQINTNLKTDKFAQNRLSTPTANTIINLKEILILLDEYNTKFNPENPLKRYKTPIF